jgi:acyl-CoA synthetase (AMP-forming)/AMP-acid ligase II
MFELAERTGDEIALADPSGHLTWAELAVKINAAAHALLESGFDQGRSAVLGSNCSATAIMYAAALSREWDPAPFSGRPTAAARAGSSPT